MTYPADRSESPKKWWISQDFPDNESSIKPNTLFWSAINPGMGEEQVRKGIFHFSTVLTRWVHTALRVLKYNI